MNLKKIDKKTLRLIFFGLLVLLVLIIIISIFGLIFSNRNLSYDKLEGKLIKATKEYYEHHKEELPGNTEIKKISVDTLVESEKIKSLDNYVSEGVICKAEVSVYNNDGNYSYIPFLDCGEAYVTLSLKDKIIGNGTVSSGDGLYLYGNKYIYRGEYVNNYVEFAGKLWRIINIDASDNTIRLVQNELYEKDIVFDDRYNPGSEKYTGFNIFEKSRLLESLEEIYSNKEEFSDSEKSLIISKQLCIGTRVKEDTSKDGSTECSVLTQDKYPLGLVQVNEFLMASIDNNCSNYNDYNCTNYNYFSKINGGYWTITPSNVDDYSQFYIGNVAGIADTSDKLPVKLAIYVNGNIKYTKGDGTEENPYVIK